MGVPETEMVQNRPSHPTIEPLAVQSLHCDGSSRIMMILAESATLRGPDGSSHTGRTVTALKSRAT